MIYIALLRAVNVGGTGVLPMRELAALVTAEGHRSVRTLLQSGNVVLETDQAEDELRAGLEAMLSTRLGRTSTVLVRTAAELRATHASHPFRDALPAQVGVLFLPESAPTAGLDDLAIPGGEQLCAVGREIFVHYPDGMGRSKLKLPPFAARGTARNLNTVRKLVELAGR